MNGMSEAFSLDADGKVLHMPAIFLGFPETKGPIKQTFQCWENAN